MKYLGESGLSKLLTLIKTKIESLTASDVGAIPATDGAVGASNIAANAVSNSFSVTLTAAGWSDNQQTVSSASVTVDNTVLISPAPTSHILYTDNGVRCISKAEGSLTFQTEDVPTDDIIVNITVINK